MPPSFLSRTVNAIFEGKFKSLMFGAIIGCVLFISTLSCEPSLLVLIHYGGLIAALWSVSMLLLAMFEQPVRFAKWISVFVTVIGVYIFASRFDVFDKRWENENGTRYVDTHHRFSNTLSHRSLMFKDGWSSGPMKGDGQSRPHGMWTTFLDGKFEHEFYWYGEPVSEGEWHLKNR